MFSAVPFLKEVDGAIARAKEPLQPWDHYDPNYCLSQLRSFALLLPDAWHSQTQQLLVDQSPMPLIHVLRALTQDVETTVNEPERLRCFQRLLTLTVALIESKRCPWPYGPDRI